MFVANNVGAGFVNGTRGKVIGFKEDQPVVELASGRKIAVSPHSWKLEEDGKVRAEVAQLPLRLAWAITIHKSQGMSLDAAEIDLSKSFTPGMGYVALSRVRSLDGLYLAGINRMALQMPPQIYEFDRTLRAASTKLSDQTEGTPEELEAPEEPKQQVNPELMARLKSWRIERARSDSVPAYVIAHDSVLELLAVKLPSSHQALLGIKGMGGRKIEQYGDDILRLVADHTGKSIDVVKPTDGWDIKHDELLKKLVKQKQPLEIICSKLGRSPEQVWQRLLSITNKTN
jgi:ATP-dependent DNA helicase PIF1